MPPLPSSPTKRRGGRLPRFLRDRRGVAAIEFAIILPCMLVMYFGMAEICIVLTADRRASHAASATGDLATQSAALYDSDISNIFSAVSTILQPYDTSTLQLRLTSVTMDSSKVPRVDWSDTMSASQPDLPVLACHSSVTIDPNLETNPGDNVLMAEAVYNYTSPVAYPITSVFKFKPKYFTRPRTAAVVSRYVGGAGSTTPKCP